MDVTHPIGCHEKCLTPAMYSDGGTLHRTPGQNFMTVRVMKNKDKEAVTDQRRLR